MEVLAQTGWRKLLRRWVSPWLRPVLVYCDGSAHDVPGLPGGWAFLVVQGERERLRGSGGAKSATSTQMELRAALEGLRALGLRGLLRSVELVSDCRLTVDVASGAPLPHREHDLAVELLARVAQLAGEGALPVGLRRAAGHVDREPAVTDELHGPEG